MTTTTTPIDRFVQNLGAIPDCLDGIWLDCNLGPCPNHGLACPMGCDAPVLYARKALDWLVEWRAALDHLGDETDFDDDHQRDIFTTQSDRFDACRRAVLAAIMKRFVGDPDSTTWYPQVVELLCITDGQRAVHYAYDSGYTAALS